MILLLESQIVARRVNKTTITSLNNIMKGKVRGSSKMKSSSNLEREFEASAKG